MDFFGGSESPFKFNFGSEPGGSADQTEEAAAVPALPAEEITTGKPVRQEELETVDIGKGVQLVKKRPQNAGDVLGDETISDSDLKAGLYEGGFKLWECAVDLTIHLNEECNSGKIKLKDANVLELGCGHGLPGIFTLLQGAKGVALQDYNREVLEELTIPNVEANLAKISDPQAVQGQVRYLAGDWGLLDELLPAHSFDLVLTTDTIYSIASQPKLFALIKHCLKREGGMALVAAKSYYFGVGGSAHQFSELVRKDGEMQVEPVRTFADGSSNVREILKLSFCE
uniref:protein-histidine N-methyltransferase n=1 Tax=Pyramimonas obovata TaxID=1411642 RepID=A0A7S0R223_9CHLO|mmetsp:Transcript_23860/g.52114  ORF Transcript_23860/g.52114 Transcript_23860/m.52114 type:complete len:285 (+) Transcript_23860:135-989(+)|eukprot:CAMPEP_0118941468 /NCGR_PEP_ID=MMETSP1169-20130426/33940_1 /TAXON_ID=36882 /ORGANISM="Pyramimonas obovata, Strain CCMP722" /LENGTH=284 /DNA_ID=CAMNT_0006886223 /DNA_START=130 /DNA_END=984 /DNA_ORIENTATION=+